MAFPSSSSLCSSIWGLNKRINDLRREIQNKANQELPAEVNEPFIMEVTTSNGFPSAMVLVLGQDDDELLRNSARQVRDDLERLQGVDDVFAVGLHDPELLVEFNPEKLEAYQVSPSYNRIISNIFTHTRSK